MGMGRLLADAVAQRTRLLQQYIDAESAALTLFQVHLKARCFWLLSE